jgi:hypothetical protein
VVAVVLVDITEVEVLVLEDITQVVAVVEAVTDLEAVVV